MTEDQMVSDTLAQVTALNAELEAKGIDTRFTTGAANDASIEWYSQKGKVAVFVCLLNNDVVIESEAGSSYDMDVAQAKENILNSYL